MARAKHAKDGNIKGKKGAIVRFGLAGLAVFGIGAAITTAAWTDDVWFTASADTAKFNLVGSNDGQNYVEGDKTGGENDTVAFPVNADLTNIVPGDQRKATLYVKNDSDVTAYLAVKADGVDLDGDAANSELLVEATPAKTALAAGEFTTIDVTVSAPTDLSPALQEKAGTAVVQVTGSTTE